MLDMIARAAWLMRSAEFSDRFPEQHVRQWEQGYRQLVIEQQPWFRKISLNRYGGDLSCFAETEQ